MQRCDRLVVRRTLSEGDGATEIQRKRLWMHILGPLMVMTTPNAILRARDLPRADSFGIMVVSITVVVGFACPLARRALPHAFVSTIAVILNIAVIIIDLHAAAGLRPFRPWLWVLLLMNLCLALDVSSFVQKIVLALTSAWVVFSTIEGAYRLGLYDIEWFVGTDARDVCGCGSPPCAMGFQAVTWMFGALALFYWDYYATSSFTSALRREQIRIVASVQTAELVATSLASFDLHAAERALDKAGDGLPKMLDRSFRRLLRNLASYKPYLPHTCFMGGDDGAEDHSGTGTHQTLQEATSWSGYARRLEMVQTTSSIPDAWEPCQAGRALPALSATGVAAGTAPPRGSTLESSLGLQGCSPSRVGSGLSTGSPSASDLSSLGEGVARGRGQHAPQPRRVALLLRNSRAFLEAQHAQERPDAMSVAAWLAEQVELFTATVLCQGGATDLLSGDHFSASFGAVKAQGSRNASAVRAAAALSTCTTASGSAGPVAPQHTAAVCGGRALCGDFGSSACMRFMVIGGASSFLPAAERAAAAWGVAVLIDSAVYQDAEQLWSFRLRQMVRFPKLSPKLVGLWELMEERMDNKSPEEWMYELANAVNNPWEGYNAVLHALCTGCTDRALALVAESLSQMQEPGGGEVAEGLLALQELARQDAPPAARDFSAAAFAGDPAPLFPRGALSQCDTELDS